MSQFETCVNFGIMCDVQKIDHFKELILNRAHGQQWLFPLFRVRGSMVLFWV